MFVNGTTSVPKSALRFVSGIKTSASALDFYKLPCYPLLLLFTNNKAYPALYLHSQETDTSPPSCLLLENHLYIYNFLLN